MTEISEIARTRNIHLGAFVISFISAPVAIAIVGFGIAAFIPALALVFGWRYYLFFGGPTLFVYLRYFPPHPAFTALLLLVVNLTVFGAGLLANAVANAGFDPVYLELNMAFGSIFAPIWGGAFGLLYGWLTDFFEKQKTVCEPENSNG